MKPSFVIPSQLIRFEKKKSGKMKSRGEQREGKGKPDYLELNVWPNSQLKVGVATVNF